MRKTAVSRVLLFGLVLCGLMRGAGQAARAEELSITVRQITRGPENHFFGYIGHAMTIPWNADGRYIVALRTSFHDRLPRPGEAAQVVLIDTQNDDRVEVIDRTLAWNQQQGTMLYWNPDAAGTQFFFNDLDPETGTVFTVLYDIAKRSRIREYRYGDESVANGGVSPAGRYFAAINYGKISRSRDVIAYAGAVDSTANGPANPETDGLFRVETATGERKLLVSYRQLSDLLLDTPASRAKVGAPARYPVYAHHTMWSRDGEWIFFVVRGKQNKRPNVGCVVRQDGTGLRVVPFAGHPEWRGHRLLLSSKDLQVFNQYDVDEKKWLEPFPRPGIFPDTRDDNAMSPDESWIAGCHKPTPKEYVYTLYRLADGAHVHSPVVRAKAGGGTCRVDGAPRWNRTGDQLLVPGMAEDGTRQLFILQLRTGE